MADRLADRRVPFLFATGYDSSVTPTRFSQVTRCEKPIGPDTLANALAALIAQAAS